MSSCLIPAVAATSCPTTEPTYCSTSASSSLPNLGGHILLVPLPGLNGLILQLSHEKLVLLLNPDRIFAFLCAFDLYLALGLHHFLTCHLG